MKAKQNKYMDLNQFVHKNGKISWNDNIGSIVEFFYNNKRHEIEILERVKKDYFKIRLDNIIIENVNISKIKGLKFDNLFYEPDYFYNICDIIENKLEIIEQIQIKKDNNKCNRKGYVCRCLIDNHEFSIGEFELKKGHGCPVCSNNKIIKGINDIATTDSHLIKFFTNKEDAYKYSRSSEKRLDFICPYCNSVKNMRIADLTRKGLFCDRCSDGISYPNKFAHELFRQLSGQYQEYISEFSPEWADKYRYDNYIKLLDGREIIVEMDGGFHSHRLERYRNKTDDIKNTLANKHNMLIIRIDCNYDKIEHRYEYIKNNIIQSLEKYFDLSIVNWDLCNEIGINNKLIEVLSYYENNPKLGLEEIARDCNISIPTLYGYLYTGEDLGLCTYVRGDSNRTKRSKPIAMYDLNNNFIGIYKSAKIIEKSFPEKDFKHRSIRQYANLERPYKNHIFKFVSYEEYQNS